MPASSAQRLRPRGLGHRAAGGGARVFDSHLSPLAFYPRRCSVHKFGVVGTFELAGAPGGPRAMQKWAHCCTRSPRLHCTLCVYEVVLHWRTGRGGGRGDLCGGAREARNPLWALRGAPIVVPAALPRPCLACPYRTLPGPRPGRPARRRVLVLAQSCARRVRRLSEPLRQAARRSKCPPRKLALPVTPATSRHQYREYRAPCRTY